MSWLSSLTGIHLGNIGAPVGAAIGSIIPGVGTAIGAGLGQALGSVGSGHSVGQAAAQGAGAYLGTKGVQSLLGGNGSGVGGILNGLGINSAANGSGSGGINIPGLGVQSLGDLAKYGLGAAQLVNQAQLQSKANNYATNAYNQAQSNYTANAPLRNAGRAGLLNAGAGNPFATRAPAPTPAPTNGVQPLGGA